MINKLKNKINTLIESEELGYKLDFFMSILMVLIPFIFAILNEI